MDLVMLAAKNEATEMTPAGYALLAFIVVAIVLCVTVDKKNVKKFKEKLTTFATASRLRIPRLPRNTQSCELSAYSPFTQK